MADEAVIIELLGDQGSPIRWTVADAANIAKGALLKINDDRTATATSADNDPFGGVAAADKLINDGSTTLAALTHGIFEMRAGAATIEAGERVKVGGANRILKCAAAHLLKGNVGIALSNFGANGWGVVLVGSGF